MKELKKERTLLLACVGNHGSKQIGTRATGVLGQRNVPGGTNRGRSSEGLSTEKHVTWAAVVAGK